MRLLRSLIRETLLLEEVYGAQAVVYHGTKDDPQALITALLDDTFDAGRVGTSMLGKGLYTVYDLNNSSTARGQYGSNIIALKVNLNEYLIFEPDIALKVYKQPLTPVQQAQKIGIEKSLVEKIRRFTEEVSAIGKFALGVSLIKRVSELLKGRVKGIVYEDITGSKCVVIYDPTTAVPIAWKTLKDKSWNQVNREIIKPALRRSATGSWEEEKYEFDPIQKLKNLEKLPVDQRVVKGNLNLKNTAIKSLPAGLKVDGELDLRGTPITTLPEDLKVGGYIFGFAGDKSKVPEHLKEKLR